MAPGLTPTYWRATLHFFPLKHTTMTRSPFPVRALQAFDRSYDTTRQDSALAARGEFLEKFPLAQLGALRLQDYVIGTQQATFCAYVEARTWQWANIRGATARKFGIYHGRTKSDPRHSYRFHKDFGTPQQAFRAIKAELLKLVKLGSAKRLDFAAIDGVKLSPMFRAKILSLYFPQRFINICSKDHLRQFAGYLGLPEDLPASQYQHEIVRLKQANPRCVQWSNPKFMAYLYHTYRRAEAPVPKAQRKVPERPSRPADFEQIQADRDRIGKLAEEFALRWEKRRLIAAGMDKQADRIRDRRAYPRDGYDFLSFSSPLQRRYIEVKAVRQTAPGVWRFFLSENEYVKSRSDAIQGHYFFYLVRFDGRGLPIECKSEEAEALLHDSKMPTAVFRIECALDF